MEHGARREMNLRSGKGQQGTDTMNTQVIRERRQQGNIAETNKTQKQEAKLNTST